MLLLTFNSTYRTSVSSLEWHPTYVVRPVGRLMPLLSLFFLLWVSEWLCVCVFELCVSACLSSTVLLVSGFRDGAMCRNGPLHCLAGRPDPSRSMSITTWNLNVKHSPLLQPFVFLCGSVGLDTRKGTKKTITSHFLIGLTWTWIYSATQKCHEFLIWSGF